MQAISVHDDTRPAVQGATSPTVDVISLSYFTISDIGDPWWGYPGEVNVGEKIRDVEIREGKQGIIQ